MTSMRLAGLQVCLLLVTVGTTAVSGQTDGLSGSVGSPLTIEPVLNAPFSAADASATFTRTSTDGTRHQYEMKARHYRDAAGSVRIEQLIMNIESANPVTAPETLIVINDPHEKFVMTVDPAARAIRRLPRSMFARMFDGMSDPDGYILRIRSVNDPAAHSTWSRSEK